MTPDISRGVIHETVHRLLQGLDIYPAPSGAFVPLDYNPLFQLLGAGAALLAGLSPATLKLVAVAGSLGAAAIIYLAVRRATGSDSPVIALQCTVGRSATLTGPTRALQRLQRRRRCASSP